MIELGTKKNRYKNLTNYIFCCYLSLQFFLCETNLTISGKIKIFDKKFKILATKRITNEQKENGKRVKFIPGQKNVGHCPHSMESYDNNDHQNVSHNRA